GHREGLAAARHPEQRLGAVAALDAAHEAIDRLRLVAGGLEVGNELEVGHEMERPRVQFPRGRLQSNRARHRLLTPIVPRAKRYGPGRGALPARMPGLRR